MAFSGMNVTFGYVGGRGATIDSKQTKLGLPVLNIVSSEYLTSAGTSTISAPIYHESLGDPVCRIIASADSWVSFGTSPVASSDGKRDFIPAYETRDYVVSAGDKVAFAVVS